jgi:hypothetical protein
MTWLRWVLEPHGDRRTLLVLAYLLLSFPLAIVAFVAVLVALVLGAGLAVTIAGVPLLVLALRLAGVLAGAERALVASLLGGPMPGRARPEPAVVDLFWRELWCRLRSGDTWCEVGYALLRLPLAVVNFVVGVALLALMLGGFALPVLYLAGVDSQIGDWEIGSFAGSLLMVPLSLLFLLVAPRLLLAWRPIPAGVATALLGRVGWHELMRAIDDIVTRHPCDGFAIRHELEHRFGSGPWVSPVRVEAALLAMTAAGVLSGEAGRDRTTYLSL